MGSQVRWSQTQLLGSAAEVGGQLAGTGMNECGPVWPWGCGGLHLGAPCSGACGGVTYAGRYSLLTPALVERG